MTKAEATKAWSEGNVCGIVGTFLSGSATEISVRDTKNGGRRQAFVGRQVILVGDDVVTVNEFMPDTFTLNQWKNPATKGQVVLVHIEQMEMLAGTRSITRGRVELLG